MAQIWIYSLVSVFIVSIISFAGAVTLVINNTKLKGWLLYLVSFSAGALLGDVFLHILPEMSAKGFGAKEGLYIIIGIFIFFALERFVWWHHSHSSHKEEIHSVVYLTQIGDSLHNFIDGVIIAASFFISLPVGLATTFAVIFHEIPQEIGNFAVLIHGGWSAKKALLYNFLSALAAVAGALVVLIFVRGISEVPSWLIAMAASSFIYISMSDLIPEIHKEENHKKSAWLLLWLILGVTVMGLLLFFE
jgi:zinc and cadmium transporter